MQPVRRIVLAGVILLGTLCAFIIPGTPMVSRAHANESGAHPGLWKYLAFRGNHFLGKVNTEVFLADLPANEAQKILISIPQGSPLEASTPRVLVIDVQSKVAPLLGAIDLSGSQAWFSPDDATALQRIRSRRGDDIWQNTYRFSPQGVYRVRKKPARAEEKKLSPEHWNRIKTTFYPYPPLNPESGPVLEPAGLLYLASFLDVGSQTASRRLYVFDRKQLHEVRMDVEGRRRLKVSYLEKGHQQEVQRDGMIDAVKISFKPRALIAQGQPPEQFSFMGLRGDFDIYLDPANRIPVQISGQISRIGQIHIRLQIVEF